MDAVFIWGGNGRTYFFKGDQYWGYDDRIWKIDLNYPRKISSAWKRVPNNVDAALQSRDGVTYLFKGTKCYKIDDWAIQVAADYPKITGREWMKCSESEIKKNVKRTNNKGSKSLQPTIAILVSVMGTLRVVMLR